MKKKKKKKNRYAEISSPSPLVKGVEFVRCIQNDTYIKCMISVTKIAEFANSVDLDEVAHNEPPHLDLHCLPSSL